MQGSITDKSGRVHMCDQRLCDFIAAAELVVIGRAKEMPKPILIESISIITLTGGGYIIYNNNTIGGSVIFFGGNPKMVPPFILKVQKI